MLIVLGSALALIFWRLSVLSPAFDYSSPTSTRPIIEVLSWFAIAFIVYILATGFAVRVPSSKKTVMTIFGFAILFRLAMLFSTPIQEVDIYRYIWDGKVFAVGVSPFEYSPTQVLEASSQSADARLRRLALLRDASDSNREILSRIHFGQLPTIYPLTSQWVFSIVASLTPDRVSVNTHVTIMKAAFVLFDLATLAIVMGLLHLTRKPLGWSVAYGWCPLVLKEIANSGHLDAIAICLSVLAIYLLIRQVTVLSKARNLGPIAKGNFSWSIRTTLGLTLAAVILSLAVGGKIYPIILGPLFFVAAVKRFGIWVVIAPSIVFVFTTILLASPMLPKTIPQSNIRPTEVTATQQVDHQFKNDPSLGVTTFLKYWEINDLIFMVVVENIKPIEDQNQIWFSVIPNGARVAVIKLAHRIGFPKEQTPFLITRAITACCFCLIALWIVSRVWFFGRSRQSTKDIDWHEFAAVVCEAAFLTLAWFWLLLPTQNPWYWVWALPLIPFARSRAWMAVSGIVMLYYLRFWFDYHFAGQNVIEIPYQGTTFFDFVVTWLEFGPWFVWLAIDGFLRRPGSPFATFRRSKHVSH